MARILVLTPRYPIPMVGGDKLRIFHLCRALSGRHEVTLLSLCQDRDVARDPPGTELFTRVEAVHLPRWRSWLQSGLALLTGVPLQVAYYRSPAFRRRVDELARDSDLAVAHLIRTAEYLRDHDSVPTVLEMTDSIALNYERVTEVGELKPSHLLYRIERRRVAGFECDVANAFDLVTFVSDVDRDHLIDRECAERPELLHVYPNGVDADRFADLPLSDRPVIVFIGKMATVQNRDACKFFVKEIFPLIRDEIPDAVFRIVGAGPERVLERLSAVEGVEAMGFVEDVGEAARGAFCGVCPMRIGAGVQNKVLEYMAMGLPTVATSLSLEGLKIVRSEEVAVADGAERFADQVIRLYRDRPARAEMGQRARQRIEQTYEWEMVLAPFVDRVDNLLADGM